MKSKERALSFLLSLVMVLTFMPALTFAEVADEQADPDGAPAVEESVESTDEIIVEESAENTDAGSLDEANEEAVTVNALNDGTGDRDASETEVLVYSGGSSPKEIDYGDNPYFNEDETIIITKGDSSYTYTAVERYNSEQDYYEIIREYAGEGDDPLSLSYCYIDAPSNVNSLKAGATFTYKVGACLDEGSENEQFVESETYSGTILPIQEGPVGNLYFYVNDNGTATVTNVYVDGNFEGYDQYKEAVDKITSISIPASISFGDGLTHAVTSVSSWALYDLNNCKSITIPASVTSINEGGIGFYWDENTGQDLLVPGITIFGTNGTAAQAYANKYGIAFRDLAAEAFATLHGTQIGRLPKIKISKPKAAKRAITVKWKKLKKKQLKSGVTNIEVWVATDSWFADLVGQPRIIGKKKASLKVKGLQKGVTYYVQVRAIKYVGGVKYYSAWSAVKKVKVKK